MTDGRLLLNPNLSAALLATKQGLADYPRAAQEVEAINALAIALHWTASIFHGTAVLHYERLSDAQQAYLRQMAVTVFERIALVEDICPAGICRDPLHQIPVEAVTRAPQPSEARAVTRAVVEDLGWRRLREIAATPDPRD